MNCVDCNRKIKLLTDKTIMIDKLECKIKELERKISNQGVELSGLQTLLFHHNNNPESE